MIGPFRLLKTMLILLNVLSLTAVRPAAADNLHRINYGVQFTALPSMHTSDDAWIHTIQLILPQIPDEVLVQLPKCYSGTGVCRTYTKGMKEVTSIRQYTAKQINDHITALKMLIPEIKLHAPNTKTKRSVLPFVGEIASSLFGTASAKDVKRLASHVQFIQKQQAQINQGLKRQSKLLSSYMATNNARVDQAIEQIKENHEATNKLNNWIHGQMNHFEAALAISAYVTHELFLASKLQAQVQEFNTGIQALMHGKLSPLLIPPQVMLEVLRIIQRHLFDDNLDFYITHNHPEYYYKHGKFNFAHGNNSLYISLHIPVSAFTSALEVYEVQSFPIPLNQSTKHASQLLDLPNILAITQDRQYYLTMTSEQWDLCVGHSRRLCPFQLPLTPITKHSCITALFLQLPQQIKELCDFRFVQGAITPQLVELDPGDILVSNISELVLKCPSSQTSIPGCHFCVINLPCSCSLTTEALYLPPRLGNCHNRTQVSKLYPVNLALIQHFFKQDIKGDTMFPSPLKISTPPFKLFKHNFSNFVANDKAKHLNLQKMAAAAKKNEQIFQDLADPILATNIMESDIDWATTIGAFVALALAIIALLVCIRLHRSMKVLMAAMVLLNQSNPTQSSTLPDLIFNPNTMYPTPNFEYNPPTWPHILANMIMALIIIIITIICIYRYVTHYRLYQAQRQTIFTLELSAGPTCVMLPIKTLPLCPRFWHFTAANYIDDIRIKGTFCKPVLNVNWHDLAITNTLTGDRQYLPPIIPLTFWSSLKLRRILREPYSAFIIAQHQGHSFYFRICMPRGRNCDHNIYPTLTLEDIPGHTYENDTRRQMAK